METNGAPPVVKIEIVLTATNQLQLSGPLEDKVLMYGLLERAKDIVRAHQTQAASRVELASGPLKAPFKVHQ
jgi:hypothetical protein